MQKSKKPMIHRLIKNRYSPRDFLDKPVENRKIISLLEAARWAPSGFNNQPWRYVIVEKNSKNRKKLENSLMLGNGWAKDAHLLIVLFSNKNFQKSANNIPYHVYDSALSMMSLIIEAENQGLKTHQIGGFFSNKVKKALSIPSDSDVLIVCAVGYESKKLGLMSKIKEALVSRLIKQRERKSLDEFVFFDEYLQGKDK